MAEIRRFEMTAEQYQRILNASKPTMYITGSNGVGPASPQENANTAWQQLANELGFVWSTATPIAGQPPTVFQAVKRDEEAKQ